MMVKFGIILITISSQTNQTN